MNFDKLSELKSNLVKREMNYKNKPYGYWILSLDKKACDYAYIGSIKCNSNTKILLMTDGFSRITDTYYEFNNYAELLNNINCTNDISDIIKKIRSIEFNDKYLKHYPRFSFSDDASAIFIRFN